MKMQGDRTNYGQRDLGRRYTLRLYGKMREDVEQIAKRRRVSVADVAVDALAVYIQDLEAKVEDEEHVT
jgi:hypothetical protein